LPGPKSGKFSFPPDRAELVPELGQQPTDHLVSKQRVGAFIGTDLNEYLRERGVTQIFLMGIATSAGVESTARSAYDYGYKLVFLSDAMTDRDADNHRHSSRKFFPASANSPPPRKC
jgi:nicotinamidase-related amidase